MARSRWCTILNGSSRESATIASPIRGATHSGSSSRASRKLASASSSRPRFRSARPTASMTSGFSGAASRACSKRARASSTGPRSPGSRPAPGTRRSPSPHIKSDGTPNECVQSSAQTYRKGTHPLKNPPALDAARDPLRGPRPLRPRQQRRLPGVLREDPHRLLARPRGHGRHRGARSRRRPRRPLRDRRDHRHATKPRSSSKTPSTARRACAPSATAPTPWTSSCVPERPSRVAPSPRRAPPPMSSSTPYRRRPSRAPTGSSPPSPSSKAAPKNHSSRRPLERLGARPRSWRRLRWSIRR